MALAGLLLRALEFVPAELRLPLLELAERLRASLGGPARGLLEALYTVTPRLFELFSPLVTRFLDEPRLLLGALERVQPALLAVLAWIESHELTSEQLEGALRLVSEQLVALWHGDGATADGERMLSELERLASGWLETLGARLEQGDGERREDDDDAR